MTDKLHEIRTFTAHFQDLQGLRLLPFGVFFLTEGLGYYDAVPWGSIMQSKGTTPVNIIIAVLILLSFPLIGAYYKDTFGKVVQRKKPWQMLLLFVGQFVFVVLGMGLDQSLENPISFTLLMIGFITLLSIWLLGQHNTLYLVGIMTCLAAFIPLYWNLENFMASGFLLILGIIWIIHSIAQHFVFVRQFQALQSSLSLED